jgi:hypothetical protein
MELLILAQASETPGVAKVGDVVAVHDDNGRWSRRELTEPQWRIVRLDRPLLETHVAALCSASHVRTFRGSEHFRVFAIDLSKLPDGIQRFTGGRRDAIIAVTAQAVEDATFKREITGNGPPPPSMKVSTAAAVLAMIPVAKRGEKPRLFSRRTVFRGVAALVGFVMLRREVRAATVTWTVGTTCGGTCSYTDIQTAVTAVPANLVTAGNSYVISIYPEGGGTDGEWTGTGTMVDIGAHTTDSSHTLTITAAAGHSFQDHANVRTNALYYNPANGVALRKTTYYTGVLLVSGATDYLTISRLQFAASGSGVGSYCVNISAACGHSVAKDLICERAGSAGYTFNIAGNSGTVPKVINVLCVVRTASAVGGFHTGSGDVAFIGCAAVRPGGFTAGGVGFDRSAYGTPTMTNCASFGFTTASHAFYSAVAGGHNCTDQSAIAGASGNRVSKTVASQFEVVTDTGRDFRAKTGSDLDGSGVLDGTNAPNDISKTTRPAGPTIGVWQIAAGAPPPQGRKRVIIVQ